MDQIASPQPVNVTHARVLWLALPMMLAHATTPLVGIASTAIIGSLGDATLVGGVATAAIVFDFLFWSFGFLRMGTAGLTAQALGAGNADEMRATLWRALVLSTSLGAALILLQALIAVAAFRLIDASPAVTQAAREFYDIRIWSAPFTLSGYATFGAIVGRGRTDLGLITQIFANVLNVALVALFVLGLNWGVKGAALGINIAEALGLAFNIFLLRRMDALAATSRARIFDSHGFRTMLMLNRDILIRTAALMFVSVVFLRTGAHVDDATLAANSILMVLALFLVAMVDGFGTAAEQLCGQSYGARDSRGFRRAAWLCGWWSVAFGAVLWISALGFAQIYAQAMSPVPEVQAVVIAYLPYAALIPLAGALAFSFDGVFIGAGWGREMRNTMLIAALVYVGLVFALQSFGNAGLWTAQILFYVVRWSGQAFLYPGRLAQAFPAAQSAAFAPTASDRRA